jgi:uncharacterized protein (DUF2235 family)
MRKPILSIATSPSAKQQTKKTRIAKSLANSHRRRRCNLPALLKKAASSLKKNLVKRKTILMTN